MGIVEGRSEDLAARDVLEGRRDAAFGHHAGGVDRLRIAEARQRRAVGAQQEDRLDEVATRLLDGKCGERAVVAGAFGHHPVDRERQLAVDLVQAKLGNIAWPAPLVGEQIERVGDGGFAAFDRYVH